MELAFRAWLPGQTHLRLHELNSSPTQTPESPVGALPQIPWTTPTLTRVHPTSAGRPPGVSPAKLGHTLNPSTATPTPSDTPFSNPRRSLRFAAPLQTKFRRQPADSDPETPKWTRRGPAHSERARPPAGRPFGRQPRQLRIYQPRRHRIGPRGTHYNQTRRSPVPAAPLWIRRGPCPPTRTRITIDNPIIRSPEMTSGSAGAPSQSTHVHHPVSTGQDTGGRPPCDSDPDARMREPTSAAAQGQRLVGLPTRAAPFLTCRSLRTKFDARPTRMGITRLGPVTSQA